MASRSTLSVSVTAVSIATGDKECIDLPNKALTELFTHKETIDEDDIITVNIMLYLKDWCNISHEAYYKLAKLCKGMPRHYKLKQNISELNSFWDIKPNPNDLSNSPWKNVFISNYRA